MDQSRFPFSPAADRTDTSRMSDVEIKALHSCKDELKQNVEPLLLASKLRQSERLSSGTHAHIIQMFELGRDRCAIVEYLVTHLPCNTNIHDLVRILDESGYKEIASRLFLAFLRLNIEGPSGVHKTTSGQRSSVHTFFRSLKRMVHDAQFDNPRQALRNLANRFVSQLSEENNPAKKQILADKCIAVIGAEIDAIAITFDNELYKHDVFSEMKKLIPDTSNSLITDVVYYGRLANANCINGKFDDSENMLIAARSRAYHIGPCLELVNMLYIEVYVRLWQYEKYPTEELRNSLMMWGRLGLESLEHEATETKTLWRRMFILRMVFCLLGIGNRANIIVGCHVDTACIAEASALLADIDRHWDGIETRREMFYCVARAKLCEYQTQSPEGLVYMRKAKRLAIEGHFEEIVFISEYYDSLLCKQNSQTISTGLSDNISRNYVVNEQHSSDSSDIVTQYMCPETTTACQNTFVENETEVRNGAQLSEPLVACEHEMSEIENTFSTFDSLHIGKVDSSVELVGFSENKDTSFNIVDPNLTNTKVFEVKSSLTLDQLKGDTDSATYRKHKEETGPVLQTESAHQLLLGDISQIQSSMHTPDGYSLKEGKWTKQQTISEQTMCLLKNINDTEAETRVEHDMEDCSSTLFEAMSFKLANRPSDLQNDPYFNLDSTVLFEERGEPSGCSRESEPPMGTGILPNDLATPTQDNWINDDTDSVDSLDLFGD